MLPFTLVQPGGREKFLKKKKDKKIKTESQTKQLSSVMMIQKNIQRFLELNRKFSYDQRKIEVQMNEESKERQRLLEYWTLTEYHVRTYKLWHKVREFWQNEVIGRNQFYFEGKNPTLLQRMSKIVIKSLPQLLKENYQSTLRICEQMIKMMKANALSLDNEQVLQIVKFIDESKNDYGLKRIKLQLIDVFVCGSLRNQKLISDIFSSQKLFVEYIMAKRLINHTKSLQQIQQLIITLYPDIIMRSQSDQDHKWKVDEMEQINRLYESLLVLIQRSSIPPQNLLILMSFLNYLCTAMKSYTINEIITAYKVNPKLFQSEREYQEYLQEKPQYYKLREALMGNYETTRAFLKKALEVIISNTSKEDKLSEKMDNNYEKLKSDLVYSQAMQYTFELVNVLGDVEIVSMSKAMSFLYESVTDQMIYCIGRDITGVKILPQSSTRVSAECKILLLLTIANKSAQQTPDLHFIKFYQSSEDRQLLRKLIKQTLIKTLRHTMFLPSQSMMSTKITMTTVSLLQNLYNKIFRTQILPTDIFQNSSFIAKFKNYEYKKAIKDEVSTFLTQFPYVFGLELRVWKFKQILRQERQNYQYGAGYYNHYDDDDQYHHTNNVKIRRGYEFIDAFDQMKKRDIRKYFKITFINQLGMEQKGIDAGGLKKEFLNRVLKSALNPAFGLFIENQSHELLPHPIKAELSQGEETQYYEFIGKLIGLAIYENITLGYKFSGTFLNAIVGKKNCFDDLKKIDPDLYKSLIYIKDMEEDASQLGLTFLYKDPIRNKNVQLIPNGHMVQVTNSNKKLYISHLTSYKVNKLLEFQTKFIRKGLTSLISKDWLFMFNYEELNWVISGQGVIDVDDLKAYTRVIGFQPGSITIKHFWEVVREFTEEQKSKLLMFVTACPRPSFLGFKQLSPPFSIALFKDQQHMLPISHTCSNVLQLPDYKNKENLRKKLLTAIESNAGFQFG